MDNRAEIRDFLTTRRAKVTPAQVGLPDGGRRRVPGLRREEVAVLAGVSPEWYIRFEKGRIPGVSDDVLNAVARALQLDEAEHRHLFDLARAARPQRPQRRRTKPQLVRPSIQRLIDSMQCVPGGPRTTSGCTRPAANTSSTPSSRLIDVDFDSMELGRTQPHPDRLQR